MTTEAEIEVKWPQAQEHLGPPKAGEGRQDPPLELRTESPGFQTSGLQTVKEQISAVLSTLVCGTLLR